MIEFMKKGIQRTSIELSEANYELVHLYASLANGKLTYPLNLQFLFYLKCKFKAQNRNNLQVVNQVLTSLYKLVYYYI